MIDDVVPLDAVQRADTIDDLGPSSATDAVGRERR